MPWPWHTYPLPPMAKIASRESSAGKCREGCSCHETVPGCKWRRSRGAPGYHGFATVLAGYSCGAIKGRSHEPPQKGLMSPPPEDSASQAQEAAARLSHGTESRLSLSMSKGSQQWLCAHLMSRRNAGRDGIVLAPFAFERLARLEVEAFAVPERSCTHTKGWPRCAPCAPRSAPMGPPGLRPRPQEQAQDAREPIAHPQPHAPQGARRVGAGGVTDAGSARAPPRSCPHSKQGRHLLLLEQEEIQWQAVVGRPRSPAPCSTE